MLPKILALNFSTISDRSGGVQVHMIKLDIEGAEYDVLEWLVGEVEAYKRNPAKFTAADRAHADPKSN